MENLRRFFSIFEVRGGKFFLERGVTQICFFFIAKLIILSCLNKTNCLVNSKAKELFMCFYVICMNKHVGITLSVFLLVLYTGARGTDHPLFLTFCLQIKVITKLPNSEQSYKGKVKTHNYINRQNQSTTGKL